MTTVQTQNRRSRRTALIVLCTGMLMIVLDATVVNVALPSIQTDLGFSDSTLAWVVNGYLIAFGGLLLLAGRLGDLYGRRRIFLIGLAVFTAASAACGLATNDVVLVVARFVQGAGGALTSSVILGMIVTMFTEERERTRAIGIYAFVASAGGAVGLLAGGILTEAISWHWIFFVNLPIGILTAALAVRTVPADEPASPGTADLPGAALVTGALMVGVYTIVGPAASQGWTAGPTLILGGIAAALLAAFVVRQHTAHQPLMPLRIFRSRTVSGANIVQVLSAAGMFGTFFLGSLYLQRILHYTPLAIGAAFLPVTVLMGTLSVRYTERLVYRFGARGCVITGLILIAGGLALFAQAPVDGSFVLNVLPVTVLIGIGAGLCFPALMTLSMADATPEDAGLASGLANTTAQVGGALGLAVLATVSATSSADQVAAGLSAAAALNSGFHLAFWIAAGLLAAAAVVVATVVRPQRVPRKPVEPELCGAI